MTDTYLSSWQTLSLQRSVVMPSLLRLTGTHGTIGSRTSVCLEALWPLIIESDGQDGVAQFEYERLAKYFVQPETVHATLAVIIPKFMQFSEERVVITWGIRSNGSTKEIVNEKIVVLPRDPSMADDPYRYYLVAQDLRRELQELRDGKD